MGRSRHLNILILSRKQVLDSLEDLVDKLDESTTFVRLPTRKERPSGREQSKRVKAINLIVDKLSEKAQSRHDNTTTLTDMWLKKCN